MIAIDPDTIPKSKSLPELIRYSEATSLTGRPISTWRHNYTGKKINGKYQSYYVVKAYWDICFRHGFGGKKRCSCCNAIKDISEYVFVTGKKSTSCNKCRKSRLREAWRKMYLDDSFRQRQRERRDAYRKEDQARAVRQQKEGYIRNKESIKKSVKAWKQRNKASVDEQLARRRALKAGCSISAVEREKILSAKRCYWCGRLIKKSETPHIDHIMPLALGGDHAPHNLVLSCAACNLAKGAKHPNEFATQMEIIFSEKAC